MFMFVSLHRMGERLRHHEKFLVDVLAFLKLYGFPSHDPLVKDFDSSLKHCRDTIETVREAQQCYMPYRLGVDPYKNSGLSAHLRADFEIRGIKERPERENKSPKGWHKKDDYDSGNSR